jgi:hypothetical protein
MLCAVALYTCRYWNDPAVLKKLGESMGDVFDLSGMLGEGGAGEGAEAAEGEEEEEEEANLHTAASDGE